MSTKKELKKLEEKADGEAPLNWKDWEKLLKKNLGTFWVVAYKYLKESETPEELLENPKDEDAMNMLALVLAVNIDEWAPNLFRAIDTEQGKERRYKKRFVTRGDDVETVPKLQGLKRDDLWRPEQSGDDPAKPSSPKETRYFSPGSFVVDETQKTEMVAMLKKLFSSDEFQRFGKYARRIGEAKLKDHDVTEEEIAKELGISQAAVSQIWKKVRSYYTAL